MKRDARSDLCRCAVAFLVALALGVPAPAQARLPEGEQQSAEEAGAPPLPGGAIRLVNFERHRDRVAICAEEPGLAIEQGLRLVPRTRVWIHDGRRARQVATAPGTCDPAWSPDGGHVAVAAPDGIWILSSDLRTTTHLVDTRHTEAPANEFDHRTVSQPKWAPNASGLAFVVSNGGTSWVVVVDAKTGETVYTSDPDTYEFSWGDDSTSLQFGTRVVRLR